MSGPGESMLVVDKYMMRIQVTHNMMEDNMLQDLTGHRSKRYWPVVAGFFLTAFFKVSVKENEVPTEKNSSRVSIFVTKASYISN